MRVLILGALVALACWALSRTACRETATGEHEWHHETSATPGGRTWFLRCTACAHRSRGISVARLHPVTSDRRIR